MNTYTITFTEPEVDFIRAMLSYTDDTREKFNFEENTTDAESKPLIASLWDTVMKVRDPKEYRESQIIADCREAEERFGLDELEGFAAEQERR